MPRNNASLLKEINMNRALVTQAFLPEIQNRVHPEAPLASNRRQECLRYLASLALLVLAGGGCGGVTLMPSRPASPTPSAQAAAPPASAEYLTKTVVRNDGTGEAPGAVESVVLLNEKLAYAQEKLLAAQAENRRLSDQAARQTDEIHTLKTQLAVTQKELADANDLLREMRQGLDKWKSDVLGFRQEMRAAQKAEIEAMIKILTLLGGSPTATPAPPPAPAAAAAAQGASHEAGK